MTRPCTHNRRRGPLRSDTDLFCETAENVSMGQQRTCLSDAFGIIRGGWFRGTFKRSLPLNRHPASEAFHFKRHPARFRLTGASDFEPDARRLTGDRDRVGKLLMWLDGPRTRNGYVAGHETARQEHAIRLGFVDYGGLQPFPEMIECDCGEADIGEDGGMARIVLH